MHVANVQFTIWQKSNANAHTHWLHRQHRLPRCVDHLEGCIGRSHQFIRALLLLSLLQLLDVVSQQHDFLESLLFLLHSIVRIVLMPEAEAEAHKAVVAAESLSSYHNVHLLTVFKVMQLIHLLLRLM